MFLKNRKFLRMVRTLKEKIIQLLSGTLGFGSSRFRKHIIYKRGAIKRFF